MWLLWALQLFRITAERKVFKQFTRGVLLTQQGCKTYMVALFPLHWVKETGYTFVRERYRCDDNNINNNHQLPMIQVAALLLLLLAGADGNALV